MNRTATLASPESRTLNLGCGNKHISQAINLDITTKTNPDVVHDLNIRPWPFPDNHFSEILAYDVIEHLDNVIATMEEISRICRPGAIVKITVPHFSSANAFTDLTHRHFFSQASLQCFTGENELDFYSQARYRRRASQIVFTPSLVNRLVWRLANRYPTAYEQRWAWIFPAWFIYFELEVIKAAPLK